MGDKNNNFTIDDFIITDIVEVFFTDEDGNRIMDLTSWKNSNDLSKEILDTQGGD